MGASGANHAPGTVPDPGASAGTAKFLREDATWASAPVQSFNGRTGVVVPVSGDYTAAQVTNAFDISAATVTGTSTTITFASATFNAAGFISTGFSKFNKIGGNNSLPPTIAVGTAAGVGATATLTVASDVSGIISLTTGTGTAANAQLLKLTFNTAFPTSPKILLFPASAAASALPIWASAASNSEQDINTGATAPTASVATYSWFYIVTA